VAAVTERPAVTRSSTGDLNEGLSLASDAQLAARDVKVTASGSGGAVVSGVFDDGGALTELSNLTVLAVGGSMSRGIHVSAPLLRVRDSLISGTTNSIDRDSGIVEVITTGLTGAVSGTLACVAAYIASTGVALGPACV